MSHTINQKEFSAANLEATQLAGLEISRELSFPSCVVFNGAMGAGKTTLSKSIIQGFGYQGEVTSPTYNLIQEYAVEQGVIYHMDLYRLEDPSELEFLAIEDLWSDRSIFLIEWPERAQGYLPKPNFEISIDKIVAETSDLRNIILKTFC